jgi:hypothetical protein
MRIQYGAFLLGFLVACSHGDPAPTEASLPALGSGSATIAGRVYGLDFIPDSTLVPVASRVTVTWVGSIPAESLATGASGLLVKPFKPLDNDTSMLPPPPPPPPVQGCGTTGGQVVAEIETDQAGQFTVGNLDQGVYDLHVVALDQSAHGDSYYCALSARSGQITQIDPYVPANRP